MSKLSVSAEFRRSHSLPPRILRGLGLALAGALIVTGCATTSGEDSAETSLKPLERPRDIRPSKTAASVPATNSATQPLLGGQTKKDDDTPNSGPKPFGERSRTSEIPSLASSSGTAYSGDATERPPFVNEVINTRVPPEPLPRFIDYVFGEVLQVPYVTGEGISGRTDIVQLRSSGEMAPATFLDLVTVALREYGVLVTVENGAYKILEGSALKTKIPQFIKSRAKITTPVELRPVVQFVELNAIDANDMVSILRQALGRSNDRVSIDAARESNYIILSGLPGDIETALEIIYQMDELDYAGTQVQRYSPAYWNARELQRELQTLLEAEGWQASVSPNSPKTILMLSIDYSNDLMIFTRSPEAQSRVNYWLNELDQPTPQGDVPELFVYEVQNLDAELLAATVNEVLSKTRTSSPGGVGRPNTDAFSGEGLGSGGSFGARGEAVNQNPETNNNGNAIVVDQVSNRLIYSGTASDYQRLLPLLSQLDKAPAEVLIEVTLADIALNQGLSYGIDWNIDNVEGGGSGNDPGQAPSEDLFDNPLTLSSVGSGGVISQVVTNNFEATIQAAANNGDARILSTPRIFARSGSVATIQVGNDVPVLTSQAATNTNVGGGGNNLLNLQSITYRSTGILLQIEPVVYGNNRVDLNVSQELSNTSALSTGGVSSPTFSNTSVNTQLSLEDGQTAVIAGLIQESIDQSNSGVPFLKDIPVFGQLFKSTDITESQREIVILITAYVLRSQQDKAAFVNEFSASFNRTAERSELTTLRPRQF